MPVPCTQLQQDFDRLADLEGDGWSHTNHYYPFLMRYWLFRYSLVWKKR